MIIWVRVVLKKKAVDNNDISTTCAAVVFRVKGSYITSVDGIIRLFEYGKSRSEDITLLRCMIVYHIYMYVEIRDPYSFFIRVVGRASKLDGILAQLQFRLPGQMS